MAVVEDDGKGGQRHTNRDRKGPRSPLPSYVYIRRFIVGWKSLGHAWRFGAETAKYADEFVVCG